MLPVSVTPCRDDLTSCCYDTGDAVYTIFAFPAGTVRFFMSDPLLDIGRDSGIISVRRRLDFEQTPSFVVNVTGNDGVFTVSQQDLLC